MYDATNNIVVRGARQHNLKGIDLDIPRNRLVVITGPSGSGKSSLAFDTIYAEGQRRYVESLSSYARQFLDVMDKPDVDLIEGLSPSVAIQQRGTTRSPRSTVGTLTEIYDYLRLLFARAGTPHCPKCGRPILRHTVQEIVDTVAALQERTRLQVLAPVAQNAGVEAVDMLEGLRREGYVRVRVDGDTYSLEDDIALGKGPHAIDVVVDRLVVGPDMGRRLADSLETALRLTNGRVTLDVLEDREIEYSTRYACRHCDVGFDDLEPPLFSFNSPRGACPDCTGLGTVQDIDPARVIPDQTRSIAEGAVEPWGVPKEKVQIDALRKLLSKDGDSLDTPFGELSEDARQAVLSGIHAKGIELEGAIPELTRRYAEADTKEARQKIEPYLNDRPCPACKGSRLRPEALAVRVADKTIGDIVALHIADAVDFFNDLQSPGPVEVLTPILREIRSRLRFLNDVGVGYLTLGRPAGTLSGGEAQRIRLATQIGSRLAGVLYVLDEPSIGLHPRDSRRLLDTLTELRDLGNTVLVVEHDREMIEAADLVYDLGPGAGEEGGYLIAQGSPAEVSRVAESITGGYLSGRLGVPEAIEPRTPSGKLSVKSAAGHNLKNVDVDIPLGCFVCVTGVSGSGKSTLINETLHPALASRYHRALAEPLKHARIEGLAQLDKVIQIDQSALGRTPRSNAATYTGLFTVIRDLFARLPEAKVRGYAPTRFSFNARGGRCDVCQGEGVRRVEMHFLPDVFVTCDGCNGKRYNRETLEVRYKGCSIADVLDMTVDRATTFFRDIPLAQRRLKTLADVGLGYLRLGQSSSALSGGEAQRVKLAAELSRVATGRTLYILDEPTTGLHFEDVRVLLKVLDRLVDKGNTVLVIEHNLDVIRRADWIIDMGPGGGDAGGEIVAEGTPTTIAGISRSHTGRYLKTDAPATKGSTA